MIRNSHKDIYCSAAGLFNKKSLAETTCKVSFAEFFTQMIKIISLHHNYSSLRSRRRGGLRVASNRAGGGGLRVASNRAGGEGGLRVALNRAGGGGLRGFESRRRWRAA